MAALGACLRCHPWQMQEDFRRILKVAAPFAGVALGWYLFMPNFQLLRLGIYSSQLLIDLRRLQKAADGVKYELTTPQDNKNWNECWSKALGEWADWDSSDPRYGRMTHQEVVLEQCGPHPEGKDVFKRQ